jgi:hypothetical protein
MKLWKRTAADTALGHDPLAGVSSASPASLRETSKLLGGPSREVLAVIGGEAGGRTSPEVATPYGSDNIGAPTTPPPQPLCSCDGDPERHLRHYPLPDVRDRAPEWAEPLAPPAPWARGLRG